MTVFLFVIILFCLITSKCLYYSCKRFLVVLYLLLLLNYILLTFYSPFVAMGFIISENNETFLKLISTAFHFQAYGIHITHSIIAVDRLVIIKFTSKHAVLFSVHRTKSLILFIIMYACILSGTSWFYCCYVVYNPVHQMWYYPNDEITHYRTYLSISVYVNGVITLLIYCYILLYIRQKR